LERGGDGRSSGRNSGDRRETRKHSDADRLERLDWDLVITRFRFGLWDYSL
jgi:hypothetical protein